jgi:hypothetical protein
MWARKVVLIAGVFSNALLNILYNSLSLEFFHCSRKPTVAQKLHYM